MPHRNIQFGKPKNGAAKKSKNFKYSKQPQCDINSNFQPIIKAGTSSFRSFDKEILASEKM